MTVTDWTIDNIVEALQAELGARERAMPNPEHNDRLPKRKGPDSSSAVISNSSSAFSCHSCQQPGHCASACSVVTSIDERRKILRDKWRCFVCMRKGHVSWQCRSTNKCVRCRGHHHLSICSQEEGAKIKKNQEFLACLNMQ